MKNRFNSMGKSLLGAMCLLSTCGLTYSCSDDYELDTTMPSYLGGSIYDELKARKFETVVKLIDDLEYKDVLSRTGSKTLFVADDEAYARFFATTKWTDAYGNPVRSYEQLSAAQKRRLLYNALLNNADVIEMLPYSAGGGSLTMRRETAATAVDSVPYWKWNELPENLNVPGKDEEGNATGDKRFWDRFRTQARGGIYMALDASKPMMTHFIEDNMRIQDITHGDITFLMNNKNPWAEGSAGGKRTYIYDAMIKPDGQDITCLNGYINVLDTVLLTPPNMAEVIRTNGKTNLFSKMLDRFSAPYYNATLTADYKSLYDIGNDSVYEKRYISTRSAGGAITQDPDKKSLGDFPLLSYDPGWNEYTVNSNVPKEQDMGAMFVPTDDAMAEYFLDGGGKQLMQRYATKENTRENLEYNLYQIPLDIIQALINNLMKDSFIESVPSKYLTITNDAQDQMFPASNADYATEAQYKQCFEECLFANNGVVYVMNRVMAPADFSAVIAPALFQKNTQVIRSVVRADDNYIEGNSYNDAPLQRYYSTYLKAMQSHFSFFVPTDEGLSTYGYVDPMSLARGNSPAAVNFHRYWRFTYKNMAGAVIPIRSEAFIYKVSTGQQPGVDKKSPGNNVSEPNQAVNGSAQAGSIKRTLLIDLIDQHIVVHESEDDVANAQGVNISQNYFISRGGAPVYIENKGNVSENGKGMVVQGGYQLQLKADDSAENDVHTNCVVQQGFDMTEASNGYGNGRTYLLDRPMQPTTKTVYSVLRKDATHYAAFFDLCDKTEFTADILQLAGFRNEMMDEDDKPEEQQLWKSEQNKYKIFKDGEAGSFPPADERLIRFFNNYRYTVYVPTDAAIQAARDNGLMTQADIVAWIENCLYENSMVHNNIDPETGEAIEEGQLTKKQQAQANAMIVMLVNFVKYHFQDETLYVDNVEKSATPYQTACIDNVNKVYLDINVAQSNGVITVKDKSGVSQNVQAPYNIMARDVAFNAQPKDNATSIKSSSFVVLHQVAKPLNFVNLNDKKMFPNGRYDDAWKTPENAKAFSQKYKLR